MGLDNLAVDYKTAVIVHLVKLNIHNFHLALPTKPDFSCQIVEANQSQFPRSTLMFSIARLKKRERQRRVSLICSRPALATCLMSASR